jgi:hypothetical protein
LNVLTSREVTVFKKLEQTQDNKWGRLKFQMKMVEMFLASRKTKVFEKVELGIYNINIICSVSLLICQGWYLIQFKYLPPDIKSILIEVQIL